MQDTAFRYSASKIKRGVDRTGNIMFASTARRSALALLALPSLALTLFADGTQAQAATVAHYQKQVSLTACAGGTCTGSFPAPGANRRLTVTRMNCFIGGQNGGLFAFGNVELRNASNIRVVSQYMPNVFTSSGGLHTINQAIDMQVSATQHLFVTLQMASGTASGATCTATGTLETLQ